MSRRPFGECVLKRRKAGSGKSDLRCQSNFRMRGVEGKQAVRIYWVERAFNPFLSGGIGFLGVQKSGKFFFEKMFKRRPNHRLNIKIPFWADIKKRVLPRKHPV